MRHDYQDNVSMEIARRIAAELPRRPEWLQLARDNLDRWSVLNANSPGLLRCYSEWRGILDETVESICGILTADTDNGQRLRQNSPFAGALPPRVIWDIKEHFATWGDPPPPVIRHEFLIRCTDAEFWPDASVDALRPHSFESSVCEGRDVHTIVVGDAEISFSWEMPGWQVVFETGKTSVADARRIVEEVLENLHRATGANGRIIDLTQQVAPIAFAAPFSSLGAAPCPGRRLVFAPVASPIIQPLTKLGGQPTWLADPQWPLSRATGVPMRFIGQVALPPELQHAGQRMAYIFMTDSDDADRTWEHEFGENAVILQPGAFEPLVHTRPAATGPTLRARKPEPPTLVERLRGHRRTSLVNVEISVKESPATTDSGEPHSQIGGAPVWLQADVTPPGEWDLIVQIDANTKLFELDFGDAGVGYAFIRRDGRAARFLWQSG